MNKALLKQQVAELYRTYGGLVMRRCQAILGPGDAASDAMQEVFIKVLKNWDNFQHEASPVTWLYRIATNVCIDEIRRHSRKNAVALTPEMQHVLASHEPSAEQVLDSRETLSRLLRKIDPQSLQILIYSQFDEMSQEEIAQVLGISRKTVWTRLNAIRKQLQVRYAS